MFDFFVGLIFGGIVVWCMSCPTSPPPGYRAWLSMQERIRRILRWPERK